MFDGLLQPTHLLLILAIALIVFGPGKLPQIGAAMGKAIRDFKKEVHSEEISEDKEKEPDNTK